MEHKKIGIIGCGNMGEAIVAHLSHMAPKCSLMVADADPLRAHKLRDKYRVRVSGDNASLAAYSDITILAVKPKDFEEVLGRIRGSFNEKKLLISIAAGITTRLIERIVGKKIPVIRVMPNMPALIGEAISSISGGHFAKREDIETAKEIFSSIGEVVEVNEEIVDAVTAVSGSGPAYFFHLIEVMVEVARELGIDEETATKIVFKTALGSAKLLASSKETPEGLRARVTSKGGTTEAAFKVFESKNFKNIVKEAVKAAAKRAKELSKK